MTAEKRKSVSSPEHLWRRGKQKDNSSWGALYKSMEDQKYSLVLVSNYCSTWKHIADTCKSIASKVQFSAYTDGISIEMIYKEKLLVSIWIDASKCASYSVLDSDVSEYSRGSAICMGIECSHFFKFLKNLGKKDSLELRLTSNHEVLEVIIASANDDISMKQRFNMKNLNIQNLRIEQPTFYPVRTVSVPQGAIARMGKDLLKNHKELTMVCTDSGFVFSSGMQGIYSMDYVFENVEKEGSTEEFVSHCEPRKEMYSSQIVQKILKLCVLSKTIEISYDPGFSLCIKISLEDQGTARFYIIPGLIGDTGDGISVGTDQGVV